MFASHRISRSAVVGSAIFTLWLCTTASRADVVVSELLYNPVQGSRYEFVELYNTGPDAVDVSGWTISGAVESILPADALLAPGEARVVVADVEAFRSAYPDLPEAAVLAVFTGNLANEGERLDLVASGGETADSVSWDDDAPWDFLADGFGASLERVCLSAAGDDAINWRAGAVPASEDEFGGSPGLVEAGDECPPAPRDVPPVFLSEIHYHAVLEVSVVDRHEFIEIHNAGATAMDLSGWRLAGAVDFEFPAGTLLDADEDLVIAKDPAALASLEEYALSEGDLFGPYDRELDNGGEKVALLDAAGAGVDSVTYDDEFPWPISADALGAGRNWLPESWLPVESHQFLGVSLERVSFDVASGEVANWAPSPIDAATPGRPNTSRRAVPLPIVSDIVVGALVPDAQDRLIRSDDEVRVQVLFSPAPPSGAVRLEHFVEDIEADDEVREMRALLDDGQGADLIAGDGVFSAQLPALGDNSIVRYRVLADRGEGEELVSPRATDPMEWHAYFVSPVIDTETRTYQLFIAPQAWTTLWQNVTPGRASGCTVNPRWNNRERAIFVHDGEVFDCRVRYQGSRWNRTNGGTIGAWRHPGPTQPRPLRALSWRISLPRYSNVGGRNELTFNKLTQGCPGYTAGVGYRLFRDAGVPASKTRYIRFHINGGYYHYMMEYERPGQEMMSDWISEQRELDPTLPREKVGHLFKSVGCTCDEGPYGWGDYRLLPARCDYTELERYAATYPRKTNEWDDSSALRQLVIDLHAARREGIPALREYFEMHFDIDLTLNYMAIINWMVPFDDMFQNHFIYQRLSDGKWFFLPWDLDRNFGGWQGANSSIYMGEQGDRSNRSNWFSFMKDGFLKSFRDEYDDRLFELNNTVLHPDRIAELVDEVTAQGNPQEASMAPAGVACNFASSANGIRSFATQRFMVVNRTIASVLIDAGPDQTVFLGTEVQFDASATTPDESPDVSYTWSNGLVGEMPSVVFTEIGDFEITLTVTVRGVEFQDTVLVKVLPIPNEAFVPSDGQLVLEAENFWLNDPNQGEDTLWQESTEQAGFSGAGYMHAVEFARDTFTSRYVGIAPELRYAVNFEQAGSYRVWMRAFAPSTRADTVHITLDGVARSTNEAHDFETDETQFIWSGETRRVGPQMLEVNSPGLHYISVFIRESGFSFDKVLLTLDPEFVPEGEGPAESPLLPVGGGGPEPFLRGDANANGRLEIVDASEILAHLFRGEQSIACEDHGDVDDDGRLQINDAIGLVNFLFRNGPAPAAPYPEVGLDTTPDDWNCGG